MVVVIARLQSAIPPFPPSAPPLTATYFLLPHSPLSVPFGEGKEQEGGERGAEGQAGVIRQVRWGRVRQNLVFGKTIIL